MQPGSDATLGGAQVFYDGFTADHAGGAAAGWAPSSGSWSACQPHGLSMKYCQTAASGMSQPSMAGQNAWSNYVLEAFALRESAESAASRVMILGHVVDATHYYDLELRSDLAGTGNLFWYIGKQNGTLWTKLAGGPLTAASVPYYGLRLAFSGTTMSAYVSYDYSKTFALLGSATDSAYVAGGVGLASANVTSAKFDAVRVTLTGSATPPPTPTPAPSSSPAPTPSPTPPSGTVVWQAGNSSLGHFETASDYQCGHPVANGSSFTFALTRNGGSCGRNQAQPTDGSGGLIRLKDGRQYTFTFDYIDGTPSGAGPGMGYDSLADSLIMQIHPYAGGNPCWGLEFDNGGINKYTGGPQEWTMTNCNATVWAGSYTPGERDHWQIAIGISQGASGYIDLTRNGTHLGRFPGATYTNAYGGSGDPWFNFGPYKSRWELANGGGSTVTQINATINNLTVTTP